MIRFAPLLANALLAATLVAAPVFAATTLRLPASACSAAVAPLYGDGFEDPEAAPAPIGDSTATVAVPGWGTATYHLHVPPSYAFGRPLPVLVALHGYVGSHAAAISAAQTIRNDWRATSDAGGFIVLAPVSNNSNGSWTAPASASDHPSDYDLIATTLAAVQSGYRVDATRRYGWGFSAGGHVMHDLAVNGFNSALDSNALAAYGVSAGVLGDVYAPQIGLACRGMNEAQCGALMAQMPRRIPVDIHVGNVDSLVLHARTDHGVFIAQGWVDSDDLRYTEFDGAHTYTQQNLGEIWNHLCRFGVTEP